RDIKAADQGHVSAQFNIGVLYNHGQGVPQEYSRAMEWILKAADQIYGPSGYKMNHGGPDVYFQDLERRRTNSVSRTNTTHSTHTISRTATTTVSSTVATTTTRTISSQNSHKNATDHYQERLQDAHENTCETPCTLLHILDQTFIRLCDIAITIIAEKGVLLVTVSQNMQLTIFAFAALVSIVAAANSGVWPKECLYTDGVACYSKCFTDADGTVSEKAALCYNADPKNPIAKDSYEYTRVLMRLTPSSNFPPQLDADDDAFRFNNQCFCFRSLTEDEIGKASPVNTIRDNTCQYHSIRCLRKIELGDVPSCAESYFRCNDMINAGGSDALRATTLRAELCQRFIDINKSYLDAINAVKNVKTDTMFTSDDQLTKMNQLEKARIEFDTRREVSCEGRNKDSTAVKDPELKT
ncbi:hypothetical protein BG003_000846, partial [Podila horticola]